VQRARTTVAFVMLEEWFGDVNSTKVEVVSGSARRRPRASACHRHTALARAGSGSPPGKAPGSKMGGRR